MPCAFEIQLLFHNTSYLLIWNYVCERQYISFFLLINSSDFPTACVKLARPIQQRAKVFGGRSNHTWPWQSRFLAISITRAHSFFPSNKTVIFQLRFSHAFIEISRDKSTWRDKSVPVTFNFITVYTRDADQLCDDLYGKLSKRRR